MGRWPFTTTQGVRCLSTLSRSAFTKLHRGSVSALCQAKGTQGKAVSRHCDAVDSWFWLGPVAQGGGCWHGCAWSARRLPQERASIRISFRVPSCEPANMSAHAQTLQSHYPVIVSHGITSRDSNIQQVQGYHNVLGQGVLCGVLWTHSFCSEPAPKASSVLSCRKCTGPTSRENHILWGPEPGIWKRLKVGTPHSPPERTALRENMDGIGFRGAFTESVHTVADVRGHQAASPQSRMLEGS